MFHLDILVVLFPELDCILANWPDLSDEMCQSVSSYSDH